MLDRPKKWPETPDIVIRLRARREAWTCIREEAASEIEKLRDEVERLTAELEKVLSVQDQIGWRGAAKDAEAKLAIAVAALETAQFWSEHDHIRDDIDAALAKIKETK